MYEFNGMITIDDLFEFNKYHYKSIFKKIRNKILLFVIVISIFVSGCFDTIDLLNGKKTIFDTTVFYIILFLVIFIILVRYKIDKNIRKIFSSNAFYKEKQNIIISENEITFSSNSNLTKLSKKNINKICFTEKAIYLYISTIQAYIISYKLINDKEKYDEIIRFIKTNFLE